MAADTDRILTTRLPIENHNAPGVFGVTSRFAGGVIVVRYQGPQGSETVYLRNPGDSLTLDMVNIDHLSVEAKTADLQTDAYPAPVLILQSSTPSITLEAAPYNTLAAGGNAPFHADLQYTAGGAGSTTLAVAPGAGYRYVVTSVYIAGDAGARVAVVDGADSAGLRILAHPALAAGGAIARFLGDPDGYVQAATNTALLLAVGGAGNFYAIVDGYVRVG